MEFYESEASDGLGCHLGGSVTHSHKSLADPEGDLALAKIHAALEALQEAEAILKTIRRYRPVGVAEKRAQLEAAGEAWPIGDDGLPKVWSASTAQRRGGYWARRSSIREYQSRRRKVATKQKDSATSA